MLLEVDILVAIDILTEEDSPKRTLIAVGTLEHILTIKVDILMDILAAKAKVDILMDIVAKVCNLPGFIDSLLVIDNLLAMKKIRV